MSFLAQAAGIALLFAAIEAVEAGLRYLRPGWRDVVYWTAKALIGLPLALAAVWAARRHGVTLEAAPVTVGISLAAAASLWLYDEGADGSGGGA